MNQSSPSPQNTLEASDSAKPAIQNKIAQSSPKNNKHFNIEYSYSIPYFHTLTTGYIVSPYVTANIELGQGSLTYDGTNVAIQHSGLTIQYLPWKKGFFVSAGFGQHKVQAKRSENITLQDPILMPFPMQARIDAQVDLTANYMFASLGWNFLLFNSINLGLSAGVINPSSPNSKITTKGDELSSELIDLAKTTGDYQKMETDAINQSNSYGKKTIPKIAISIGTNF